MVARAGVFTRRSSVRQTPISRPEHRVPRTSFLQLIEVLRLDPAFNAVESNIMQKLRALLLAVFRPFATAAAVRGGSGHYREQCHPQTFN